MLTLNLDLEKPVVSDIEKIRLRPMGLFREYLDTLDTKASHIEMIDYPIDYASSDVTIVSFLLLTDKDGVMYVYKVKSAITESLSSKIRLSCSLTGSYVYTLVACSDKDIESRMCGVSVRLSDNGIHGYKQLTKADTLLLNQSFGVFVGVIFEDKESEKSETKVTLHEDEHVCTATELCKDDKDIEDDDDQWM